MLEKDVVLSKISIIKNCLQRIKTVTQLKPETLEDVTNQDVFVLNLQRYSSGYRHRQYNHLAE